MKDVTLHAGLIGEPDAVMPTTAPLSPAAAVAKALGRTIARMNTAGLGPDGIAEVIEGGVRPLLNDLRAAERARCAQVVCDACFREIPYDDGYHLGTSHGREIRWPCPAAAIRMLE